MRWYREVKGKLLLHGHIDEYEDAKKVVQDAGLIDENDGHPDIHYRKIAQLLAERDELREELKKVIE